MIIHHILVLDNRTNGSSLYTLAALQSQQRSSANGLAEKEIAWKRDSENARTVEKGQAVSVASPLVRQGLLLGM